MITSATISLATMYVSTGCQTKPPGNVTVDEAWRRSQSAPAGATAPAAFAPSAAAPDAIALVNGEPMPRSHIIDLLLESHGVNLLEQMIVLDAAKRRAEQRNITINKADIDAEYQRSLEALMEGSPQEGSEALRRQAEESLLEQMLASRNASRQEYMLVMERNAVLRKLVESDIKIDDEQLRTEFNRRHGERVQIRHIQVGSPADVKKVQEERAGGAEFGDLAVRYSANRASAERLGSLPPFTADDPTVPEPLRREAFLLPPGQDSNPLEIDGWYHLIRVDRRIEAGKISFERAREEVERSLRERKIADAMRDLYAELFSGAKIEIVDPKVRELFFAKYPNHGKADR